MKPSSSRVASLTGRDVGTHRGTRVFDLLTSTAACWGGVVDDLPEVSVGVAEVAGVDAPGAVVRAGHGGAGLLGLQEEGVDIGAVCEQMSEAELAALCRSGRDLRVLGELAARVEGEDQFGVEVEHDGRAVGIGVVAG